MSEFPGRASAVIVGAGIVGNSLACHLARLGWRDLVLVDKGPMPNPGGSTGHASNFIFPIEYSKMMMELTRDSTEQYQALGVFTRSGGIEVARTPARMAELHRRCTAAKAWGIPAQVITPAEVAKLVPYLDESVILGGAHFPTVGVVNSLRAGTLMREEAQASGALAVLAGAEVLGIDTAGAGRGGAPRITAVRTTAGDIETSVVVVCCGVWSPRIARMAGAHIPLTPIVHQMISVGPIGLFAGTPGEISYPIVRDVDTNMYERQHGGDMEVGSYAHRPIIVSPDDIPSIEESALSPTELPFTADDFDPQLAEALELMPELLGDESAGVRYAINGLISMTPDGHPLLGPVPGVDGLWSAAASWIKEGPGVGRAVAEWMSGQVPTVDVDEANIARFYPCQRTTAHIEARAREGFNKMYGIVHPAEQWESGRPVRVSPVYDRERELGAVFHETAGWERPHWYASNEALLERYEGRLMPRSAEWDARWWSPVINAEHLAMRESCALVNLSAFAIFDVTGPSSLDAGAVAGGRPAGRGARPGRLHLAAGRAGRVQGRPDHHAARPAAVPGRHRRGHRPGRPGLVRGAPARRRLRRAGRPDLGPGHAGPVGPAGPPGAPGGDGRRREPRRIPVRHLPGAGDRRPVGARLAHLLRRRAGLGTARADGAGRPPVGRAVGGRAPRTGWCRPASACTAPPGGWKRATGPWAPSSPRTTRWSRRG